MIVADATLLVYLVVGGPEAEASERVLRHDDEWVAPPLWESEVRNALLGHIRKAGMPLPIAVEAFELARHALLGRVVPVDAGDVLKVAVEHGLSAYDAEYVVLAQALGVRLVTSDKRVLAAVPDVAVRPDAFADAAR